jgi:hypothetical protein
MNDKRSCGEYEGEEWESGQEFTMTWPEWCDLYGFRGWEALERVYPLLYLED